MPYAEDSTGHGGEGREMGGGESSAETGVLHSDFNGQCFALGLAHAECACQEIAKEVPESIMHDDNSKNDDPAFGNSLLADGDYRSDNGYDCNYGDERQDLNRGGGLFAEQSLDDQTQGYGEQNNLKDRNKQSCGIDGNPLAGEKID